MVVCSALPAVWVAGGCVDCDPSFPLLLMMMILMHGQENDRLLLDKHGREHVAVKFDTRTSSAKFLLVSHPIIVSQGMFLRLSCVIMRSLPLRGDVHCL